MQQFRKLAMPYLIWLSILVVMPMFMIVIYAFSKDGNAVQTISFTFDNFSKFFEGVFLKVLWKSFYLGIVTTVLCLLLGYPMAYFISQYSPKVQTLMIMLVTVPTWINMLIRTYAWFNILGSKGLINSFLQMIGMSPIDMLYTDFAVILGMVYNFLPFMILPIHTALTKMDKSLIEASMDLGANKFITFWKITFKLSLSGVFTGIMMVFLPSVSTFVIPKLLGGAQYILIGNFIEEQFLRVGDWNFGSAVSLILAVLILVSMRFMKKIDKDNIEEKGGKRNGKKQKEVII